jgi:hypothetical protein
MAGQFKYGWLYYCESSPKSKQKRSQSNQEPIISKVALQKTLDGGVRGSMGPRTGKRVYGQSTLTLMSIEERKKERKKEKV